MFIYLFYFNSPNYLVNPTPWIYPVKKF